MTTTRAPIEISPLAPGDWPPQLREMLAAAITSHDLADKADDVHQLNVVATLAHHPQLAIAFGQLLAALTIGDLPERAREMIILRTACLNRSTYEWSHHYPLAERAGLSEKDINQIGQIGSHPTTQQWSTRDKALLTAVDDLHHDGAISSDTGRQLADYFQPRELLELICLAGSYRTVSTVLQCCQVPLESGVEERPLPSAD